MPGATDGVDLDADELAGLPNMAKDPLKFLYVNFSIRSRELRGYIAVVMDLHSLQELKTLIGEFIESVLGEGASFR